jgi:benzoyl-CoA reductase subunit BamC
MERIEIDYTKCTGCRYCEIGCSLSHVPDVINPKKSRIRVIREGNRYFPVIAGPFTDAMCNSKGFLVLDGVVYDQCLLCRASCPTKPVFKEPDTDIPLKCDFCMLMDQPGPSCVKWCTFGALRLVEE